MTPSEEEKAKRCCESGLNCTRCPLYNPRQTTDECYEFWEKHSPYSVHYESEDEG